MALERSSAAEQCAEPFGDLRYGEGHHLLAFRQAKILFSHGHTELYHFVYRKLFRDRVAAVIQKVSVEAKAVRFVPSMNG